MTIPLPIPIRESAAIETRTAEDRHWWFASRTRALLSLLDQRMPAPWTARLLEGKTAFTSTPQGGWEPLVLDVGCGAGNMVHHLQRYGRVVGIDNFLKPLVVARDRGYEVYLAAGEAIPFRDDGFALVSLLDVLEHCDDDHQVLRECVRVLRPGGLLAITVPAFPWLWSDNDVINRHRRRYTPSGLRHRLQEAGLQVLSLTCNNFFILPAAVGVILWRRLSGRRLDIAAPITDEDAYQVEMQPTAPLINSLLTRVGALEAWLLPHLGLPLGTGIIAVARKP